MKVNPIKYGVCFECSDMLNKEIQREYTIQFLREIKIPQSRNCFGRNRPLCIYICSECGSENY